MRSLLSMEKDRREYERVPVTGEITIVSTMSPGETKETGPIAGTCKSVNISSGGLCIVTEKTLSVPSVVRVNVPVPGVPVEIPALAMVMWQEQCGSGSMAGLKFII